MTKIAESCDNHEQMYEETFPGFTKHCLGAPESFLAWKDCWCSTECHTSYQPPEKSEILTFLHFVRIPSPCCFVHISTYPVPCRTSQTEITHCASPEMCKPSATNLGLSHFFVNRCLSVFSCYLYFEVGDGGIQDHQYSLCLTRCIQNYFL